MRDWDELKIGDLVIYKKYRIEGSHGKALTRKRFDVVGRVLHLECASGMNPHVEVVYEYTPKAAHKYLRKEIRDCSIGKGLCWAFQDIEFFKPPIESIRPRKRQLLSELN